MLLSIKRIVGTLNRDEPVTALLSNTESFEKLTFQLTANFPSQLSSDPYSSYFFPQFAGYSKEEPK